ncbi:hypothetical protein N7520_007998 [Penicillium odoratum]|uniref:uncharacterized protein n=1 Tax=Penicillium odoratum TaxID=1167516 RepID=UPI002548E277|nr:uncharacterized protein N7520_007998 [Penicillium odoratum]KAJ5760842.1 hypothetical protein N7520_007998 [Penicillium odoratum]
MVLLHIEYVSHATIPYLVQGDFRVFTAPNDRRTQYNGKCRDTSEVEGVLADVLEFYGLLDATPSVADVMDTEEGSLCYTYDVGVVE